MPLGNENVFPAVVIGIKEESSPSCRQPAGLADAGSVGHVIKTLSTKIAKQSVLFKRECRNEDIGPPVSVEVVEGHSQSLAWVLADAARPRHVQKCPVALVLVKEVGNGGKLLRVAIRTQFWPAAGDVMEIPLHIPTDEKVQVPIVIVVEKTGAGGPAASSHPRPCRDIDEGSIALVPIELV